MWWGMTEDGILPQISKDGLPTRSSMLEIISIILPFPCYKFVQKFYILELKSREEFENCDVSNPIKLYDGGLDAVPLIEMGDRYFTSGNAEDCQRGMKVHINFLFDGLDNGQSDKFDVVSNGLDNVAKDLGLDLLSDGMEHYIIASASDDLMEEGEIKEVIV
ncbi:hypothetical protein SUGI_0760370 [Cryptomeria japonica]|nr:hypothetical protein SUGI_0760370 [Cryptomeria japonica]